MGPSIGNTGGRSQNVIEIYQWIEVKSVNMQGRGLSKIEKKPQRFYGRPHTSMTKVVRPEHDFAKGVSRFVIPDQRPFCCNI